eukprot:15443377-Alexandrium_andersonii.AAC.1
MAQGGARTPRCQGTPLRVRGGRLPRAAAQRSPGPCTCRGCRASSCRTREAGPRLPAGEHQCERALRTPGRPPRSHGQ